MKPNLIQDKSYAFSLKMINLYRHLTQEKNEYIIAKQILRSGTSIGANIEESIGASSKKDFLSKLTISYKEVRETIYWLRLLRDSGILENDLSVYLLQDVSELARIIGSIQRTTKRNLKTNS